METPSRRSGDPAVLDEAPVQVEQEHRAEEGDDEAADEHDDDEAEEPDADSLLPLAEERRPLGPELLVRQQTRVVQVLELAEVLEPPEVGVVLAGRGLGLRK